jgi:hypothetical protein
LLQEQDFPESNLITADRMGKKVFCGANCCSMVLETRWKTPLQTAELRWSRLRGNGNPERSSSGAEDRSRLRPDF